VTLIFTILIIFFTRNFRLGEYRESQIVGIHRIFVSLFSLILTLTYCTGGHGVCRPLPLKFYLMGLQPNKKFHRDPLSLAVTMTIIVLVILMQFCIEVKKHKVKKKEEEIERLALNAERHLAAAQLCLQHQQEQLPLQVFNVTEQVKVSRKVYCGKTTVAVTF
jgi:hypothetical protein